MNYVIISVVRTTEQHWDLRQDIYGAFLGVTRQKKMRALQSKGALSDESEKIASFALLHIGIRENVNSSTDPGEDGEEGKGDGCSCCICTLV